MADRNAVVAPQAPGSFGSEFVVAAAQILDEGESGDDDRGGAVGAWAAHGPRPVLKAAEVGIDAIVGVLLDAVPRRRHELVKDPGVDRGNAARVC
jgi:hypothetical protein